jgi:hypothetical protein
VEGDGPLGQQAQGCYASACLVLRRQWRQVRGWRGAELTKDLASSRWKGAVVAVDMARRGSARAARRAVKDMFGCSATAGGRQRVRSRAHNASGRAIDQFPHSNY